MKTFLTLATACCFCVALPAQWSIDSLDINSVSAKLNSNGDLFTDYSSAGFRVPKDSTTNTIFAGALWIGGMDAGNNLHLAAQTYRQTGNDFYPGPVMNPANYSAANDALWNKVWKINKTTIDSFRLGLYVSVPAPIASWPGNGDVSQGQAALLAPFVDQNNDGIYSPAGGDYPCIKGDQTLFVIFNDARNTHGETGGLPLGVEFHLMLYAFSSPGNWLDSVVFINYKMYNRTAAAYTNTYIGSWTDFDIGAYDDDYLGCDVPRETYFGYNGDANDGTSVVPTVGTYGANPPAQGVVFLHGPLADASDGIDNDHDGTIDEAGETCLMSRFQYYNNDLTVMGNPVNTIDYYHYLSGSWLDGSPVTFGGNAYGGSTPCNYVFPGDTDPDNTTLWNEQSAGNTPGDRHGIASSGPFTLQPNSETCLDYAYVFGRGTSGPSSSVTVMRLTVDSAKTFYNTTSPCSCVITPLSVNEHSSSMISLYPNPAKDNITIEWQPQNAGARLELYDVNGKIVSAQLINRSATTVDLSGMAQGIYMVRIIDGNRVGSAKVIKQ